MANSLPVIALDIDGVVRDIASYMCHLYNSTLRVDEKKVFPEDLYSFDFSLFKKEFDWRKILFRNPIGIVQLNSNPYNDAVESICDYSDKLSIYAVTNQQSTPCRVATSLWLQEHRVHPHLMGEIYISQKSLFKADFLIDDFCGNIELVRNEGSIEPVLIKRPWNSDLWSDETLAQFYNLRDAFDYCYNRSITERITL